MFNIFHQGLMEKQVLVTASKYVKSHCLPGWKDYHLSVTKGISSCLLCLLLTVGNSALQNR